MPDWSIAVLFALGILFGFGLRGDPGRGYMLERKMMFARNRKLERELAIREKALMEASKRMADEFGADPQDWYDYFMKGGN